MAQQHYSGQRLVIKICSIAATVLILSGLGLKIYWDNQYGTSESRRAIVKQFRIDKAHRTKEFEIVYEKVHNTRVTPVDIAKQIGGNTTIKTFPANPIDMSKYFEIIDAHYGVVLYLNYDINGSIIYVHCCSPPYGPSITGTGQTLPDRKPIEGSISTASRLLVPRWTVINLPLTILPWLWAITLAYFKREWRSLAFACTLWIIGLSAVVLMMSPQHHLFTETFSNDPLFCIVIMLMISISGIVWDRIENHPDMSACPSCGYTLLGNTSGVCPECGETLDEKQRAYIAQSN